MKKQVSLILVLFLCGGLWLISRLYTLHLKEGPARAIQAERQYGKGQLLYGRRGALYDRFGKELAFDLQGKRVYPRSRLAAHVLGFVGKDGRGLEGIEYLYDSLLQGSRSHITAIQDGRGKWLYLPTHSGQERELNGKDITLTLDEFVQHTAEEELAAQVTHLQAKGGMALIIDPFSGEILALAVYPSFDPNAFYQTKPRTWRNRAIADSLEPGSTFKVIPMAAALEEGLASLGDQVNGEKGALPLSRGIILRDTHPHDQLSLEEVIAQSSNIGTVKISRRLGREKLYSYTRLFGFGSRTGIELPGEAAGLVNPLAKWSGVSLEFLTIGQEIGVTPLQLAMAYTVIANGGILLKPRIIKAINNPGKPMEATPPQVIRRVLSEATCRQLTQALIRAVAEGTGAQAALAGYKVAGKTGTAQKMEPGPGKSRQRYLSSFVGFVPAHNPRAVILVMIDEPQKVHLGGLAAAPVFQKIARKTLRYWQKQEPRSRQRNVESRLAFIH